MNELTTQQGHLCQSSSQAFYCSNIFSNDENNLPEHHPDEKCSRLVKMQIQETHSKSAYFGSFFRSHFRFKQIRAKTLSFEILRHTIKLRLWVKAYIPSIGRSVPQILTF